MPQERQGEWSLAHCIVFRFIFSYLVLYNIPQQGSASIFDILPWISGPLNKWCAKPMQPLAIWLGKHIFHLQGEAATFHVTGSGDTALNYVLVFICLCGAVVATALWSILDRKRTQYRTLDAWLRLLISFVVAESMLEYGFAKVFPGQFGPVSMSRLNESYGESSPMALLWTFMSGSRWYTMFGGLAEVGSGLLLFFRRTRTLGALLAGAVIFNIVMLNFCYDVPVKLYSSHLLLMCIFLAAPDAVTLARLFVFRGEARLNTDHIPASEKKWIRRTGYVLLGLMVACTIVSVGFGSYGPYPPPPDTSVPLYGRWHVDTAQATTTLVPWSDIFIDGGETILVKQVDGTNMRLKTKIDPAQHTLAITSKKFGDGTLHYLNPSPRHLTVDGSFNHGQLDVVLTRTSPDQYLLLNRGFHWVSEYPYNH